MTTIIKRLGLALAVALILPEFRAHADLTWDFSQTVSDGTDTSVVSGTLTTTSTPAGGPYTVTGIMGTWSFDAVSLTIQGLIAPGGLGGNDNMLSPVAPFLSNSGISFTVPPATINGISVT
jgi:hypothetical protein